MWDEAAKFINTVGFPIFVCIIVLLKIYPIVEKLKNSVTILTIVIAQMGGVDYAKALKLANETIENGSSSGWMSRMLKKLF